MFHNYSNAQHWEQAKSFTYVSKNTRTKHTSDHNGNVFVAGEFGSDTNHLKIAGYDFKAKGYQDIFIIKFDLNLNVQWVKTFGNFENESIIGIAVDNAGDFIISGYFSDSIYFDAIKLKSKGSFDFFLVKFDTDGNVKWARSGGSIYNDKSDGILGGIYTDKNRNIYACGSYDGTDKDTKPNAWFDSLSLKGFGSNDLFITKYTSEGKIVWLKNVGSFAFDVGQISGGNEGIYLYGLSDSRLNYDSNYLHDEFGNRMGFVLKMDSSGNFKWANAAYLDDFGTISVISGTTDLSGNFIAVGTYFCASSNCRFKFDNHISNGKSQQSTHFLTRINPQGKAIWVREMAGYPKKIITKSNNHFIISGNAQGELIYDGQVFSAVYDYLLEIDSLGKLLNLVSCQNCGTDMSLGLDGNLTITGSNQMGDLAFDNIILPSPDKPSSLFIAKRKMNIENGLNEIQGNRFLIYPNPSHDRIKIQAINYETTHTYLKIYNIEGQDILEKQMDTEVEEIETSNWPNGLYLFKITSETYSYRKLILVAH
jgi:hypothetical protein